MNENFYIDSIENLADSIVNDVVNSDENIYTVSAIGYFDELSELIKHLLRYEDVNVHDISIMSPEVGAYGHEYILSLMDDYTLWCEPLYRKGNQEHIAFGADKVYIFDNCNVSLVSDCEADSVNIVKFDYNMTDNVEEVAKSETSTVAIVKDKTDSPIGFSKKSLYSKNGIEYSSIVTHYCNDINQLRNDAKNFGIEL